MKSIVEMYNLLPKYLRVMKGKSDDIFRLIIVKNEWDDHEDACIARYAKEGKIGFSKKSVILETKGRNLAEAIEKMYNLYTKIGPDYIQGKTFFKDMYDFDQTHRKEEFNGKEYYIKIK